MRFFALGLIAALVALCGPALQAQTTAKRSAKKAASAKSKKKTVAVRRVAQQQPTPERYKEIQQALTDKGYFHGTVDGNWGADSTDALKRFQREQSIEDDGKIGSLSLIALGLGPRGTTPATPPAPVP